MGTNVETSASEGAVGHVGELKVRLEECGHTLPELEQRVREFRSCVETAIYASTSISLSIDIPWREWMFDLDEGQWRNHERQKAWKHLDGRIPVLLTPSMCRASASTAAKDMCRWLDELYNQRLVGRIRWMPGLDTAWYSYYLNRYESMLLERQQHCTQNYDPDRPEGERCWYITDTKIAVRRRVVRERHVHHIIDGRVHALGEYRDAMPRRAVETLKAVPDWLAPLIHVVTGTIVREEKEEHCLTDGTVHEEERTVVKRSPAIILGPFVLSGWSSDDVLWQDKARWLLRGGRMRPIVR